MKQALGTLLCAAAFAVGPASANEETPDTRLYELRTYHAAPDKLDDLLTRFRDHTCELFEKHGMTNVGYWTPVENEGSLLIYLLSYPDGEARERSWQAFLQDEAWTEAKAASETDGALVSRIDSLFLTSTAYTRGFAPSAADAHARRFEMRTYTAADGRLEALEERFQNHTLSLFETHGMTNLGYFRVGEGQEGAEGDLLYFIAHRDAESAAASWQAFREDEAWLAARAASEEAAGGSLTAPEGIRSLMLEAVDFSTVR